MYAQFTRVKGMKHGEREAAQKAIDWNDHRVATMGRRRSKRLESGGFMNCGSILSILVIM